MRHIAIETYNPVGRSKAAFKKIILRSIIKDKLIESYGNGVGIISVTSAAFLMSQ